ncbi:MAG TPA: c-type cytochrome [Terracidiphilus sp.]|nr:c-type cytochrome [Terracidiphilus sp.]
MLKRLLLTTLAGVTFAGLGFAAQPTSKVTIPVNKTSATSGKEMFTSYCAPCHGVDGRGHGPVVSSLKTTPNDLTMLSKNNHGVFPDTHIASVLDFGSSVPTHGTAEMPVWGPILGKMNVSNSLDKQLRISNLSRYIESIQAK